MKKLPLAIAIVAIMAKMAILAMVIEIKTMVTLVSSSRTEEKNSAVVLSSYELDLPFKGLEILVILSFSHNIFNVKMLIL